MLNIFDDKDSQPTEVACVLRVGTLSEIWHVTSMNVDGDYNADKIRPRHVDTGERDPGKRPGYDAIYDAHFTATVASVIVMYPNAIRGRDGSRFFEATPHGMQELATREEVLEALAKTGGVEPVGEYA